MICVSLSCLVCLVVYQNCIFLFVDVAFLLLCSLKVEFIVNIRYALSAVSRRGSKAGQGIRPSVLISREKHLYLKGKKQPSDNIFPAKQKYVWFSNFDGNLQFVDLKFNTVTKARTYHTVAGQNR